MYRYGEYCPLAKTTSILGDYWTPLIVRELLHGRTHFNDLVRSLPNISRSLLASRLKAMERSGIIDRSITVGRSVSSYSLTPAGLELRQILDVMSEWGERWTEAEPNESEIHPMTTVCMLRARCDGAALPAQRTVIEVVTKAPKQSRSWLVLENGVASLCEDHPGFDVDLVVTTDVTTLYQIWRDQLTVSAAVAYGLVEVDGQPSLMRAFPSWFAVEAGELSLAQ